MQILDGTGTGKYAKVDSENRLFTLATIQEKLAAAAANGDAYSWSGSTYNYAAADTVLLIRNTSTSKTLVITDIYLRGDTETDVVIHFTNGAAFTLAGTVVAGCNLNRGNPKTPDASAYQNETGNTIGTQATGRIYRTLRISADAQERVIVAGGIRLASNTNLGVDFVTDGGEAYVTIIGYFE